MADTAAKIVRTWVENGCMHMAAYVMEQLPDPDWVPADGESEDDRPLKAQRHEYIGSVPLAELLALNAVKGELSDVETDTKKRDAVRAVLREAVKDRRASVLQVIRPTAPRNVNLGGDTLSL